MLYQEIKAEFLPQRKTKIRSNSLPWMNSKIGKIMNERYKCLCMAQRSGISNDSKRYRQLRNKVNKALKRAEANYWKMSLSEVQEVSTNVWTIVRQLNKHEKVRNKNWPTEG